MNIFIIHPIRNASQKVIDAVELYVKHLEDKGHSVYDPQRDTEQDDPIGLNICNQNKDAILNADEVHIAWDGKSTGSLFDIGMAFMANKKVKIIKDIFPDKTKGKSFANMIRAYSIRD